jgi:hypothetical protein
LATSKQPSPWPYDPGSAARTSRSCNRIACPAAPHLVCLITLRTDGNNRYSRMKNRRSPILNWTRPRTFRCNTTNCCRSAAFSASSRLVDLSGEINRLRKRDSSATIAADGYVIPSPDQYGRRFRYTQLLKVNEVEARGCHHGCNHGSDRGSSVNRLIPKMLGRQVAQQG